jgi:hypothetical protein
MSAEDKQNDEQQPQTGRRSRRDLLKTAGIVAGAAVAGKLASADSASAADGQPLVVAFNNSASNISTGLTTAGVDAAPGLQAFKVVANNFDYALYGEAQDYGVWGTGAGGVLGTGTVGGVFSGLVVAINLDPQDDPGAPQTGEHFKGDLIVDSTGVLYLCVADSVASPSYIPGTWIRVSHGGVRYLATPQRAYDSRTSGAGKLRPGFGDTANPRVIPIAGVVPGVPSNALGVVGNLAVTQEDTGGFATLWPSGAWPGTANINFNPGVDLSNSFNVGLSGSGTVSVAAFGTTHVVIDIAAYVL